MKIETFKKLPLPIQLTLLAGRWSQIAWKFGQTSIRTTKLPKIQVTDAGKTDDGDTKIVVNLFDDPKREPRTRSFIIYAQDGRFTQIPDGLLRGLSFDVLGGDEPELEETVLAALVFLPVTVTGFAASQLRQLSAEEKRFGPQGVKLHRAMAGQLPKAVLAEFERALQIEWTGMYPRILPEPLRPSRAFFCFVNFFYYFQRRTREYPKLASLSAERFLLIFLKRPVALFLFFSIQESFDWKADNGIKNTYET